MDIQIHSSTVHIYGQTDSAKNTQEEYDGEPANGEEGEFCFLQDDGLDEDGNKYEPVEPLYGQARYSFANDFPRQDHAIAMIDACEGAIVVNNPKSISGWATPHQKDEEDEADIAICITLKECNLGTGLKGEQFKYDSTLELTEQQAEELIGEIESNLEKYRHEVAQRYLRERHSQ